MKNIYLYLILIITIIIIFYCLKYKKKFIESYSNNKPYIWMFWETLPGKNKPGYIDLCYNSVNHNCKNCFNIIYLNESNIKNYIPEIEKYNIDHLKIQHKADIYRYLLLNKYGGLWVDADILVLKCLCKYYKNLDHYDYVGFGCGYNKNFCSKSLYGYGSPLNWLMGSKPNTKFLKCIISNVEDKLKNKDKVQYHEIGRNVLKKCHDQLRDSDNWSYYHVPSKCNEYDTHGNKLNNIFTNIDNSKCENERYFFPFYNTAPGYPQWFKNLSADEIINHDLPINKIVKEAFSSKEKCKNT
jgi:hypothetical protein